MSWKIETFGTLLTESRIPCDNPDVEKRIRVKLNVQGVEKRPIGSEKEGATNQFIRKARQFIYGKQNFHKGAFGIIPEELDGYETSADIPSFDVREDCLPEWIYYFFKAGNRYLELVEYARGVGSKRIHPKQLADLEIPLPPIEDQKKIIKELKFLESNGIYDELNHQLDLVKQLRQAFLREAMQGKLTAKWRNENPDVEPARLLLKKIKAEKEKLIMEGKLKNQKPLQPIKEDDFPFEIPESWEWCRLGEIINFGPSNGFSPVENKKGKGIKCLTLTATTSGKFKEGYYKFVDEKISKSSYLWIKENDILLQRGNSIDFVGIAALCPDINDKYIYPDLMIKIRVGENVSPQFIHQLLISPKWRLYFQNNASGAQKSMPKINQSVVVNTFVPLPPLPEQQQIVARLDELMQYCDKLEESIKTSQQQNEMLLQQVLREALDPKT